MPLDQRNCPDGGTIFGWVFLDMLVEEFEAHAAPPQRVEQVRAIAVAAAAKRHRRNANRRNVTGNELFGYRLGLSRVEIIEVGGCRDLVFFPKSLREEIRMCVQLHIMSPAMDFLSGLRNSRSVVIGLAPVQKHRELGAMPIGNVHHFANAGISVFKAPPDQPFDMAITSARDLRLDIDCDHYHSRHFLAPEGAADLPA